MRLMAVTTKSVFVDVMPCSLVEIFHFRGSCLYLDDRTVPLRQQVPPKWAISNKLHGVTTQMKVFFSI